MDIWAAVQDRAVCALQLHAGSAPGALKAPDTPRTPLPHAALLKTSPAFLPMGMQTAKPEAHSWRDPGPGSGLLVLLGPHETGHTPCRVLTGVPPHLAQPESRNCPRRTTACPEHRGLLTGLAPRRDHQLQVQGESGHLGEKLRSLGRTLPPERFRARGGGGELC